MSRALVLGGAGPAGYAWQCGLIAGFARAGADLAQADAILATSTGAIVGARLACGGRPAALADALLAGEDADLFAAPAPLDLARAAQLAAEARSGTGNPAEARRELCAFALAAATLAQGAYLGRVARLLAVGAEAWPGRGFTCAAIDAESGGFELWDGRSGVGLAAAVAASAAAPGFAPPVAVAGRRCLDGALRSPTNADLAAGHDLVVVVTALPDGRLEAEVESLKAGGSTVVTILPDEAASLGDLMRPGDGAAAQAGLAQAARQAAILKEIWG